MTAEELEDLVSTTIKKGLNAITMMPLPRIYTRSSHRSIHAISRGSVSRWWIRTGTQLGEIRITVREQGRNHSGSLAVSVEEEDILKVWIEDRRY